MKILIVTPYKDSGGGVETVTKTLASVLVQNKYQVDYLTLDMAKNISPWLKFQVFILGKPAITKEMYKSVKQSDYSAVICNGEYGLGINHKHAISYFHGSYLGLRDFTLARISIKSILNLTLHSYLQKLASRNKVVVSVSEFLNTILNKQGINVNYTISNPVDFSIFYPMRKDKKGDLLYVGRYDYYAKGFDVLELLAAKGHRITCVSDVKKNVFNLDFLGMVPYEHMPSLYSEYKILILPSRFESFGMAAVEAMACGIPVIMNKVGIAETLIKEIPEFVVDDLNDLEEIDKRIKLINSRYTEYSERSREYCKKYFSLEKYGHDWLKVLHD